MNTVEVNDSFMAYTDTGDTGRGVPVVFLHGTPPPPTCGGTSSRTSRTRRAASRPT